MAKILIGLFEAAAAAKIAQGLTARGHEAATADTLAKVRTLLQGFGGLFLFNYLPECRDFLPYLKQYKNSPSAAGMKVIAAVPDGGLGTIETLFQAGADECVVRPFRLGDLLDKIEKLLAAAPAADNSVIVGGTLYNAVPKLLNDRVEAIRAEARELGDIAEIFSGIMAHDGKGRRMVAPSPDWQPVLTEKTVAPFFLNDEREYYFFSRAMLNRVPEKHEYFVPEKVIVKRLISPLAAALDTSRLPFNSELFGIVTVKGLEPGYLTCILNSRFAHFYFQRYRPPADGMQGIYFSRGNLEALPVIVAPPREQEGLSVLARGAAKIPPDTKNDSKKIERSRLLAEINRRIFSLYGFTDSEVRALGGLHY